MARTGRPRKPTHLKLIEGTHRKDRANPKEPKPKAGTPQCPKTFGEAARAEWKRIIPEMRAMGILNTADRAEMARYCQFWARWQECEQVIDEQGMTFQTEKGYVVARPEVNNALKYAKQMSESASKLGLNPQARSTVKVPDAKPKADNTRDFLFGNGRKASNTA
jgi:P27 family predicted phage terminase small subunit